MRVISGVARGRPLKAVPGQGTRPTTDKVKGAIFSSIGPYFEGGYVLDLFAGTGSLGIEALSRGMERGVFIDKDRSSIEVIHNNLSTSGFIKQAEVYRNDALRAIKVLSKRDLSFDLIFIDPPYRMTNMEELFELMESCKIMREESTVVMEHDAVQSYADQLGILRKYKQSVYGDTAISYYTYDSEHKNGVM